MFAGYTATLLDERPLVTARPSVGGLALRYRRDGRRTLESLPNEFRFDATVASIRGHNITIVLDITWNYRAVLRFFASSGENVSTQ